MPTPTEQNARDIADLADRLDRLDDHLIERFNRLDDHLKELRSDLATSRVDAGEKFGRLDTELRIIRKLGTWLLGGVFGAVAALITGAATIGWSASAVVAEAKHQAARIDGLEKRGDLLDARLDGLDAKLDTLISRTPPRPAPTKGQ